MVLREVATVSRNAELFIAASVRFVVVGPTHTRGDTAFFVEGDNVLLAGDVVMKNSFVAATGTSSMKAWLAAFDTLDALKPRTIVPAHGEVGPGTIIATNRSIMAGRARTARLLPDRHSPKPLEWPLALRFRLPAGLPYI